MDESAEKYVKHVHVKITLQNSAVSENEKMKKYVLGLSGKNDYQIMDYVPVTYFQSQKSFRVTVEKCL